MKRAVMATSAVVISQKNNDAALVERGNDETRSPKILPPTLPIRVFRPNKYMEIAFDTRTRTPFYVMECLEGVSRDDDDPTSRRRAPRFHEEATLPVEFRSRNGHYRGSGYDRGHLAPAADFQNNAVKDTYTLCNTVPQDSSMNRRGWAQLEAFVRRVAKREWNNHQATTYVITGPLWLPCSVSKENVFNYSYEGLGKPPCLISVPTHLWKVVAVVRDDEIVKFAAFVMPNSETTKGRVDLSQYLVRLTDLEAVTGMHFFPGMQDFRQNADALTENVLALASESGAPLLLIEGGPPRKVNNSAVVRTAEKLRHLCTGGKCQ